MTQAIDTRTLHSQLCNALERERCSLRVYDQALAETDDPVLWRRWSAAAQRAQRTEQMLLELLAEMGLDPEAPTPARQSARAVGDALLRAIRAASAPQERRALARDCVRIIERRDQVDWELFGHRLSMGDVGARSPRAAGRSSTIAPPRERMRHRLAPNTQPAVQAVAV